MNLNEKQKELYSGVEEQSKESVAMNESLGFSHGFAVLSEKIEIVNMMLVPAMSTTGHIAGEVKELYKGCGPNAEEVKKHLANGIASISQLASIFNLPLEEVAEEAFKVKE